MLDAGERELDMCDGTPGEIEALQASLLKKIVAKFPQFAPFIKNAFDDVTQKSVENRQIDDHADREERSAKDMAEEGCYRDDDGDGAEPRIRGMMKGPTATVPLDIRSGEPVEDLQDLNIVDRYVEGPDAVSLGQIADEGYAERGVDCVVRVKRSILGQTWSSKGVYRVDPKAIHDRLCEMCAEAFKGTVNARLCRICRSPKYRRMWRDNPQNRPVVQPAPEQAATAEPQDVRQVIQNFLKHGEMTTAKLRTALQSRAGVEVTEVTEEYET